MRTLAGRFLLIAVAATVGLSAAPSSTAQPGSSAANASGTRRALLIGINEYVVLPDLRGALNDLELLQPLLVQRFGFRPEHIRTVTDESATRAGILEALEALVQESGPNDFVFIHYSGHGSQVPDQDGDEQGDGFDETLVPHDGRTAEVSDILDDELAAILSRLQTDRVVVSLDSCHSGTATRDVASLQSRWVQPDDRTALYAPSVRTRALVPFAEGRYVLFTAAAPHQKALDGPVDGRPHGLFSFALAQGLSAAGPDGSPREVLAETEKELARIKAQLGLSQMPEPQLEGPEARIEQPILARAAAGGRPASGTPTVRLARLPFATAVPLSKQGFLSLRNAGALGAAPGSLWAVYPPGEINFPAGGAIARAVIVEVKNADALARIEGVGVAIPRDARAIALMPPAPEARTPVRWIDPDPVRATRRQQLLASRLPELRVVSDGAFARFVVECNATECRVFGADGSSILAAIDARDDERFVASLAQILARSLTATELLALHNPASSLRLDLRVAGAPDSASHRSSAPGPARASLYWIRAPGEARSSRNSLQVQIAASHDCWLTLVSLDPEGRIQVLFPNPISEQRGFLPGGRVKAGQTVLIPDSLAEVNRAGFHLDYAPPAGIDTIRAFCSAEPATGKLLRGYVKAIDRRARAGEDSGDSQYRAIASDELGALRSDLSGLAVRGVALVPAPSSAASPSGVEPVFAGDWTAGSLTIQVANAGSVQAQNPRLPGPEIPFLDSSTFDSRLSAAMRGRNATVTVRFVVPAAVDRIPERADRWLQAVSQRDGGKVELAPDPELPATRDVVGIGVSIVTRVYEAIQKRRLYSPAGDYDAVVFYHPTEKVITRIEFRRR